MPPKSTSKLDKELMGKPGYDEAKRAHGFMYIGRKRDLEKSTAFSDLELHKEHKEASAYYGCMFCPDPHFNLHPELKHDPKARYAYNRALVAGAIEASRSFILVSNVATEREALLNGYTADELFWLQDNGYIFKPDPSNPLQTLVEPTTTPREHELRYYHEPRDYREPLRKKPRKARVVWEGREERLNTIIDQILADREHLAIVYRTLAPAASSTTTEKLQHDTVNTVGIVSALSSNSVSVPVTPDNIPIPPAHPESESVQPKSPDTASISPQQPPPT